MDEKGQAKIRLVELVQLALFQKKKSVQLALFGLMYIWS